MEHIFEPTDQDRCNTQTCTPSDHTILRTFGPVNEILNSRSCGFLDTGLQPERYRRRIDTGRHTKTASGCIQTAGSAKERGAIFTRREVVDFILDLAGYTSDKQLHTMRALEPAFGDGDFLIAMIERCLNAWESAGRPGLRSTLAKAIVAVELHDETFARARHKVIDILQAHGLSTAIAEHLASVWFVRGDYLLCSIEGGFDFVVGNPPYVRHELIDDAAMVAYRNRYRTIVGRSDLYIPFIERSLSLLNPGGQLGFICSDRWMKNGSGASLRKFVSEQFHLRIYVDMVGTQPFRTKVTVYPAITIIARQPPGSTRIARRPKIDANTLGELATSLVASNSKSDGVEEIKGIVSRDQPWIFDASGSLALVRWLEARFPLIEETGCKISIGVTTGADKAFIGPFDTMDVEFDRKLPLAMTADLGDDGIVWGGLAVINPFGPDGKLVDLEDYPRLRSYLNARRSQIASRYVAQKSPASWYRTVDRICPELRSKPKLLIPDVKGKARIVYDSGKLYPHHNLYFISSDQWNLHAMQAVLRSGIAELFVAAYSTRIRGGYLRFQAQYLRRIRLPRWQDIGPSLRKKLIRAGKTQDAAASANLVIQLYGLSLQQATILANERR